MLKIGELFAGYGGLGMGVMELLDAEVTWVSEFDKHPSTILTHRFPDAPNLGDITKIDWAKVDPVDIITGGSPCQDLSQAGMRLGMKQGTRSGLWINMLEAIKTIRPKLVVWENVGGAFSAEATSEMEPCPGCVGHGDGGAILRALGRVLGDLTEAGYDAEWHSLRAADIGAPHGRLRVFVTAWPRETGKPRLAGRALTYDTHGRGSRESGVWAVSSAPGQWRASSVAHEPSNGSTSGRPEPVSLLPTPAVNDMGAAYDPETWDQWTARMKQAHGNGNGHGKSLNIEALRLMSTPQARDYKGVPGDGFNNASLPRDIALLRTPCADETGGCPLHPDVAKERNQTLRLTGQVLAATGNMPAPDGSKSNTWGDYGPAIARWEALFWGPAPDPTLPTGKGGKHQLSARFVEWMMGVPDGHVTGCGLPRNAELKALGNGVFPRQAAEALRRTLDPTRVFFNA